MRGCLITALLACVGGCALVPDVKHKPQYYNPFPQIKQIAVLPFANQSEEPTLSGERVALAYANELQAVPGFEVLPVGAVKAKLAQFSSPIGPEETTGEYFQRLARFLGVDAVLVGAVTDFTPYYPPRMTMKVNWYAANPGFHPVLPGYGLPWGTKAEKKIPRWIHHSAQRALAAEQLKTQTPDLPTEPQPIAPIRERVRGPNAAEDAPSPELPAPAILPEDHQQPVDSSHDMADVKTAAYNGDAEEVGTTEGSETLQEMASADDLPEDWPDPRGFIPDPPSRERPQAALQSEAIIEHMSSYNGHDEDFTERLSEYFYFRDDARFGGWQAYLQRSEDFIRLCCHFHLTETLASRGGQDESRLIFRWPIVRYQR